MKVPKNWCWCFCLGPANWPRNVASVFVWVHGAAQKNSSSAPVVAQATIQDSASYFVWAHGALQRMMGPHIITIITSTFFEEIHGPTQSN